MLSIANEVDLLIFCCVYFVCNTNHVFSNTNSILDAHKKNTQRKENCWMQMNFKNKVRCFKKSGKIQS